MKLSNVVALFLSCLICTYSESIYAEPTYAEEEGRADIEIKAMSGMSVLGNNEAPKSLIIVPWKSSSLNNGLGIENLLDERANPVDKEVFVRELGYYELRTAQAKKIED
jgi:hypothetical protein